jgi:release factor glutamine methyltransferase
LKNLLKYFVEITYKPLLVKWLSKTRTYIYKGIELSIPSEVFHPGFFFSTKLLLRYIHQFPLQQKSFLELGAGSGLISIFAARKGALVTATDINTVAIEFLEKNRDFNGVRFNIIHSDLFDRIPAGAFDIVAINPPYYKKQPRTYADYAWCCGENGEYFEQLFSGLPAYTHSCSEVYLVLCDGCDLEMIRNMAGHRGFHLDCVLRNQNVLETNFIFKIKRPDEVPIS